MNSNHPGIRVLGEDLTQAVVPDRRMLGGIIGRLAANGIPFLVERQASYWVVWHRMCDTGAFMQCAAQANNGMICAVEINPPAVERSRVDPSVN